MDLLLNPNISYLILVTGFLLIILAILSPGTGLLEVGALFALILAAYCVYNLPFNLWALLVLVLGVIPFLIAVRQSQRLLFLGISILALVLGSAFLFRGEVWWQPAVHPLLALLVSTVTAIFFWVSVRKVLEAEKRRPSHDLEGLIGALGEAKSEIHLEGSVQVAGELWSAYSNQTIPAGTTVRVVQREGFLLEVEPVNNQS
jgi:membrane-bound serine protease (ClpP class)